MNFKDRVRQALRQPTNMATGGFVQDAGGGDKVVYGPTHEQGGVPRGADVELEGGGFGPDGQPLAGEVITTVQDNNGNDQEFYMSHQNGIAQRYLQAKAQAGGSLPQEAKQEFAKMNEQVSSDGHPEQIAAHGGMKKYFTGGLAGTMRNEAAGMMAQNGGMRKYFMGGMPTQDVPQESRSQYGTGVEQSRSMQHNVNLKRQREGDMGMIQNIRAEGGMEANLREGDTVNGMTYQGGDQASFISGTKMKKYLNGGARKRYDHGGPHRINEDGSAGYAVINKTTSKPWTRDEYYAAKDNNTYKENMSNPSYYGEGQQNYESGIPGETESDLATTAMSNGEYKDGEGNKIDQSQFKFNPSDYDLFYDPESGNYKNFNTDEIVEDMSEYKADHQKLVSQYLEENFEFDPQPDVIGSSPAFMDYIGGPTKAAGAKVFSWMNKSKIGRGAVATGKYIKNSQVNPLQGWKAFRGNVKVPYKGVEKQWIKGATKNNAKTALKKGFAYGVPAALYSASGEGDNINTKNVDSLDFTDLNYNAPSTTNQSNIYDSIRPEPVAPPNTTLPDSLETRTYNGINYQYRGGSSNSEGATNPDNWHVAD